jgi:hypothetical protein
MGNKSDKLRNELALALWVIRAIERSLGIPNTDSNVELDAGIANRIVARVTGEIDKLRAEDDPTSIARLPQEQHREDDDEAVDPQDPDGYGDPAEVMERSRVRAEMEQHREDDDTRSADFSDESNDLDMLRTENGNLRATLSEKSEGLTRALDALNRITAAAGIDRWTPDGQQVVDKLTTLSRITKGLVGVEGGVVEFAASNLTARRARSARLSLTEAISGVDELWPVNHPGLKHIRALIVSARRELEGIS